MLQAETAGRVDWVDVGKGLCIIFVVMMHSTLGVEAAMGAEGWMHALVAFAAPFRMPDFFLIAGLFLPMLLGRAMERIGFHHLFSLKPKQKPEASPRDGAAVS